jgi:hypothetical protein
MKSSVHIGGFLAVVAVLVTGCVQPERGPHGMAMGGAGGGMGMGMGGGMGRMEFGPDNTPAWPMMSSQERDAHRGRMMGFKSEAECHAYLDEHHRQMNERAKANGQMLNEPRHDMCQRFMSKP